MIVLWDVEPFITLKFDQRFRDAYRPHHKAMMASVGAYETSIKFYQTTRRDIPEDRHLHIPCREGMKPHICYLILCIDPCCSNILISSLSRTIILLRFYIFMVLSVKVLSSTADFIQSRCFKLQTLRKTKRFPYKGTVIKYPILFKYVINISPIHLDCLVIISEINLVSDEHYEFSEAYVNISMWQEKLKTSYPFPV
jgi:hypothetical protein